MAIKQKMKLLRWGLRRGLGGRGGRKTLAYTLLALGLGGIDLLLKHQIETEPQENFPRPLPAAPDGPVEIERVHNPGFALGWQQERPWLVQLLPLAITLQLIYKLLRLTLKADFHRLRGGHIRNKAAQSGAVRTADGGKIVSARFPHMLAMGYAFMLGGAISNMYDRLKRKYVVDYLHIRLGVLDKIVVNLGDIWIAAGAAMMSLSALWRIVSARKH